MERASRALIRGPWNDLNLWIVFSVVEGNTGMISRNAGFRRHVLHSVMADVI